MKLRILALGSALALLAAPAAAYHCPADMAKIDAVLAENPELSPDEWGKTMMWRKEGEALHDKGRHDEALELLGRVREILGID